MHQILVGNVGGKTDRSGPTALGLTTTLLSLGLDHPGIRKRLMIFSFAAPLGAVITYAIINAFGGNSVGMGKSKGDVDALQWWTGIALLFSVSRLGSSPTCHISGLEATGENQC